MIINVKYDVGDTIKYVHTDHRRTFGKCECCGGGGNIIGMDYKAYTCPRCHGTGMAHIGWMDESEEKEGTIWQVIVEYDSHGYDKPVIKYSTPHEPCILEEEIIERVVSEQEKLAYTD